VKSRWATDYDRAFPIRSFDCDFVVLVALNRGWRGRRRRAGREDGRREPQFYVFPVEVARAAQSPRSKWHKAFLRSIDDLDQYLGNWGLIRAFLGFDPALRLDPSRSRPESP
jgi:hypothetical protein